MLITHWCLCCMVFVLSGNSLLYFLVPGCVKPPILNILVYSCLDKLHSIGFSPAALICDQGVTNRCFLETLCGVSVDQPFTQHKSSKIFVVYDPPLCITPALVKKHHK